MKWNKKKETFTDEEDYVYSRKEYPNCFHDTIVPKGWERKEKFVKPKE